MGAAAVKAKKETYDFWSPEREAVLLQKLPMEPGAKERAIEQMRILHPRAKDLENPKGRSDVALRFAAATNGIPAYHTIEFWQHEIKLTLIEGIYGRKRDRPEVIERIRMFWPEFETSALFEYMEKLAIKQQPEWLREEFWEPLDPILRAGLNGSNVMRSAEPTSRGGTRVTVTLANAVAKVSKLCPTLRAEIIWARIAKLVRRQREAADFRAELAGEQAGPKKGNHVGRRALKRLQEGRLALKRRRRTARPCRSCPVHTTQAYRLTNSRNENGGTKSTERL